MSNDVKLEPCPFCGGEGEIEETGGGQASSFAPHYRGNCSQYGCANMVWTTEKAEAIAAWNARHQPQEREAVLDEAVVRTFAEGLWAEARKRGEMRPEFMPSSRTDFLDEARKQLTSLTTPAPAASRDEIVAVLRRIAGMNPSTAMMAAPDMARTILSRLEAAPAAQPERSAVREGAVMKVGNDTCPKCLAAHPVTFDCGQTINVRTAPAPAEPTPVGDVVSRDEM